MPDIAIFVPASFSNKVRITMKRGRYFAAENDESLPSSFLFSFLKGSYSIYSASIELARRMVKSRNRTRKAAKNESPEEFVA